MRLTKMIFAVGLTAGMLPLAAQENAGKGSAGGPPISTSPVVRVEGVIRQVHISQGQGMPYLEVQQGSDTVRVYLGSMRYLIAENFNPKSGQQVHARGYKRNDGVVAIEVSLPAEKKTLKLRDERGWPLWRGGRHGRFGPPATGNR